MLRTCCMFLMFFSFQSVVCVAKELILNIKVDTLRYDSLEAYGNERALTPHLDRLIESKGVLFDYAFAASNHTRPSVLSLFTGLYPTKHGIFQYRSMILKIEPNLTTILPEEYKTIYVNANPNTTPLLRKYFDYGWSCYPSKDPLFCDSAYYPAEYIFEKARGFLSDANFPEKTFIYIQPADPHAPYYPLKDYPDLFVGDELKGKYSGRYKTDLASLHDGRERFVTTKEGVFEKEDDPGLVANARNRYDAEVRYLDEHFYSFWGFINKNYQKILLIFTSDHGESFLDHNDIGHGNSLYNEQIRIPFIVIDTKKRFGKPRRSPVLISNIDILPTIADVVGYKEHLEVDGKSILKLMKEQSRFLSFLRKKRLLLSEYSISSDTWDFESIEDNTIRKEPTSYQENPINILIRAVIEYGPRHKSIYKYIENKNRVLTELLLSFPNSIFYHKHYSELYKIDTDPEEKNNLINTDLRSSDRIVDSSPLKGIYPEFYRREGKIDRKTIDRLKSLGYIH